MTALALISNNVCQRALTYCKHMVLFGHGLWSQMFGALSFSLGHNVYVCARCLCPRWNNLASSCSPEPNHFKLACCCLFYWLPCFRSFLCISFPVSSSVRIALFSRRSVKTRRWFLRRRTWEIDALDARSPPSVRMLIATRDGVFPTHKP